MAKPISAYTFQHREPVSASTPKKLEALVHKMTMAGRGDPEGFASFMRMGRFSVIITRDKADVGLWLNYAADDRRHMIGKGSEFFEVSKRDRLRQIANVRAALIPSHPFYLDVLADMAEEEAMLSA